MVDPAPPASALHYGAYSGAADALELVATGQRLTFDRREQEYLYFHYDDGDASFGLRVIEQLGSHMTPSGNGANLRLGFGPRNVPEVMRDYGLWRRVSWFLVEALLVRQALQRRTEPPIGGSVSIAGGWLSDRWSERVIIRAGALAANADRWLVGPVVSAPLYPFGRDGLAARYHPGTSPTAQISPAAASSMNAQALDEALRTVPRYVLNDGTVVFFSQVDPHVGPDYAPGQTAGMLYDEALLFFSPRHGLMRGEPMAVTGNPTRFQRPAERKSYGPGPDRRAVKLPTAELLEQMFFAELAALGTCAGAAHGTGSRMVHPEYADQTIQFDLREARCDLLPHAIGLSGGLSALLLNEGVQDHPDTVPDRKPEPVPDRMLSLDEYLAKHGIKLDKKKSVMPRRKGFLDWFGPYFFLTFICSFLFLVLESATKSWPVALVLTVLACPLIYIKIGIDKAINRWLADWIFR